MRIKTWVNLILVLAISLIMIGCAAVGVQVPVMRPAEIDLKGKNELIVGEISGRGGNKIGSYIKERVIGTGRFKLVDRKHLNRVLDELKLSQSDLADSESRKKLGKLMTGSILIMGQINDYRYNEDLKKERRTCIRYNAKIKKSVNYPCTYYQRSGVALASAAFDVIDIETGEILRAKTVKSTQTETTSAYDGTPSGIDGNALLDQCARKVAVDFLKAIAPWKQILTVNFMKHGDLPMLETGINYAKAGQWNDAIAQFKQGVEQAATTPKIDPKTAGKAHWDLGLAYEYTNRFDDAIVHIKKAFSLSGNEDYLKELKNVERRKIESKRLKEQKR